MNSFKIVVLILALEVVIGIKPALHVVHDSFVNKTTVEISQPVQTAGIRG